MRFCLLLLAVSASAQSIFQVVPTPNGNKGTKQNAVFSAAASSPSDIWAVGDTTIHFDGTSWTAFVAPQFDGGGTSWMTGVADLSPTDAWAVGLVGVDTGTVGQAIEHWDGTRWSVYSGLTFPTGDEPEPCAMTAISANDIWAVGSMLTSNQLLEALYEHWDGTAWTAFTGPLYGFPTAVSADAANDLWVVGYSENGAFTFQTFAEHFDGTNWSRTPTPDVGNGSNMLSGVLALAPDNVWAVGYSTPALKPPPGKYDVPTLTLIEHYDGTSWSVVPSPNMGPDSQYESNRLLGLTAVSANDIWAFGSYFAASGSEDQSTLLLHWDGTSWTIADSPTPKSASFWDDILYSGVVTAPGSVWIVGSEDPPAKGNAVDGTLVLHTTGG
jgi:hypothetical protein